MLPLDQIEERPQQNPRQTFDNDELKALAASIEARGLLQPIRVAHRDGKYILTYGARRVRAFKLLKRKAIPAVVDHADGAEQYLQRLVENEQRVDPPLLEYAQGLRNYMEAAQVSTKELAERVGRSVAFVTQHMSVLKRTPETLQAVHEGKLSFSHVRALAGTKSPEEELKMLKQLLKDGKPRVRDVERAVSESKAEEQSGARRGRRSKQEEAKAPDIFRSDFETAVDTLMAYPTTIKPKTEVRDQVIASYKRYGRARSEASQAEARGIIKALEWAIGVREDL